MKGCFYLSITVYSFEFMPVSEYGKKDPQTIGLKEVELDKNYALIISTNGGLWRYLLGDTIRFYFLKSV